MSDVDAQMIIHVLSIATLPILYTLYIQTIYLSLFSQNSEMLEVYDSEESVCASEYQIPQSFLNNHKLLYFTSYSGYRLYHITPYAHFPDTAPYLIMACTAKCPTLHVGSIRRHFSSANYRVTFLDNGRVDFTRGGFISSVLIGMTSFDECVQFILDFVIKSKLPANIGTKMMQLIGIFSVLETIYGIRFFRSLERNCLGPANGLNVQFAYDEYVEIYTAEKVLIIGFRQFPIKSCRWYSSFISMIS